MIFHVRKWMDRLRFVLLFLAFTFMFYHILLVVTRWIEPDEKYKEPSGRAVKAFQGHVFIGDGVTRMGERLRLFYWIGE